MNRRQPVNRAVIGLMLLAALATYADAPRLAGTVLIGGAVNYIAALDYRTRAEMHQRVAAAPHDAQLAERLDDGERSRAIVESMPELPGVVPAHDVQPRLETISRPPCLGTDAASAVATLAELPVATLALPPPPGSASQVPARPLGAALPVLASRPPPRLA